MPPSSRRPEKLGGFGSYEAGEVDEAEVGDVLL